MAGINTNLFTERVGQFRILSIVFAIATITLTANNYFDESKSEDMFWWGVIIFGVISVVFAGLSLMGALENEVFWKIDKYYHIVASGLLLIISTFFIVSVDYYHKNNFVIPWTVNYEQRAIAGACGIAYGIVCGIMGWLLL